MTNRQSQRAFELRIATVVALGGALVTSLAGCEDPPPPPPPAVVVAPPPPPPPPKVTKVSDLMARLNIDSRVDMREDRAPMDDKEREAILTFFDGFARGDSSRLQPMLAATDQFELEKMVKNGNWEQSTKKITKIDVRAGKGGQPVQKCVLAVIQVGNDYEPQLWSYKLASGGPEFEAIATPPRIMDKLSGEDWIAAWFDLIGKDFDLANLPDENPKIPKTDLTTKTDSGETEDSGSGPSGPSAPGPSSPGQPSPSKRTPGKPIKPVRPGFNQN